MLPSGFRTQQRPVATPQPPVTKQSVTLGSSRPASPNMAWDLSQEWAQPWKGVHKNADQDMTKSEGTPRAITAQAPWLRTPLNGRAACEDTTARRARGPLSIPSPQQTEERPRQAGHSSGGLCTAHNGPHSPWKRMAGGERGGRDIPSPPHMEGKATGSPGQQRPAEEDSLSSHFPFELHTPERTPPEKPEGSPEVPPD